jgi:hypothetical protein
MGNGEWGMGNGEWGKILWEKCQGGKNRDFMANQQLVRVNRL